jgi:hypothetical protein
MASSERQSWKQYQRKYSFAGAMRDHDIKDSRAATALRFRRAAKKLTAGTRWKVPDNLLFVCDHTAGDGVEDAVEEVD